MSKGVVSSFCARLMLMLGCLRSSAATFAWPFQHAMDRGVTSSLSAWFMLMLPEPRSTATTFTWLFCTCYIQRCSAVVPRLIDVDARLSKKDCDYLFITLLTCTAQRCCTIVRRLIDVDARLSNEECNHLFITLLTCYEQRCRAVVPRLIYADARLSKKDCDYLFHNPFDMLHTKVSRRCSWPDLCWCSVDQEEIQQLDDHLVDKQDTTPIDQHRLVRSHQHADTSELTSEPSLRTHSKQQIATITQDHSKKQIKFS